MSMLLFIIIVLNLLGAPTYFYWIVIPIYVIEWLVGFFVGTVVGKFITRNS